MFLDVVILTAVGLVSLVGAASAGYSLLAKPKPKQKTKSKKKAAKKKK